MRIFKRDSKKLIYSLNKKRTLIILRWLIILVTAFLMVNNKNPLTFFNKGYLLVGLFFLSNIFLTCIPPKVFESALFTGIMVSFDILLVSLAIVLFSGIDSDFYLIYFLIIFIASLVQSVKGNVVATLVISLIYSLLVLKTESNAELLNSNFLIRIPFLYIIGLFCSFLTQEAKIEKKQKEELRLLLEISQLLYSTLDIEKIYNFITESTSRLIGINYSSLMLYDTNKGHLITKAVQGPEREAKENSYISITKFSQDTIDLLFKQKKPLNIPDIKKVQDIKDIFFLGDISSFLSLPLVSFINGGEVMGLLNFGSQRPNAFKEDELRMLLGLSILVVTSIENARLYYRAKQLAITDGLTGLYNHRYFQERLHEEIVRAERYQHPLTLMLIDIDHFKNFNDTYGHLAGDEVLREIANILKRNLREIDIVSRYGGEEFTVILPETDRKGGKLVAERIRRKMEEHIFRDNSKKPVVKMTISLGVASFPEDAREQTKLIQYADCALYRSKQDGRNRVS